MLEYCRKALTLILLLCIMAYLADQAGAQAPGKYELTVSSRDMEGMVRYLADDYTRGRESGSTGKQIAERYIYHKFKSLGLKPYNWSYTQSVRANDSVVLRNVTGLITADTETDKFVIIGAHYDHLGTIGRRIYSGADDNASGVAAMLSIATMFSKMKASGEGPKINLLFVAFDGKEMNLGGSTYFVNNLSISRENIVCFIDLDMMGTDLVPPRKNTDYIFELGDESLPKDKQDLFSYICHRKTCSLDLDKTFYGSRTFYKMMLETSDTYPFRKAGIPSLLFTSAFHEHTYKVTDKPGIINYGLLLRRTRAVFHLVCLLSTDI